MAELHGQDGDHMDVLPAHGVLTRCKKACSRRTEAPME